MRYRTLGKTGLKVSEIGMGGVSAMGKYGAIGSENCGSAMSTPALFKGMQIYPVVQENFDQMMSCAEEKGINFIDTAPSYGDSEKVFGRYLKNHRAKWIVCTKVGTCGSWGNGALMNRDDIFNQVSDSLERLQLDYIDLLLIHSLDQYGKRETAVRRITSPGSMIDALCELKEQGKCRFIGASGQLPELIPAADSGVFDVMLTYNTFNLLVQDAGNKLFPLAREKNIGIILGGVLYQGLLTGNPDFVLKRKGEFYEKDDPASCQTQKLVAEVERLAEYVNGDARALRQLAFRFALSAPAVSVIVSAMKSIEEVEENVVASDLGALTQNELRQVMEVINKK